MAQSRFHDFRLAKRQFLMAAGQLASAALLPAVARAQGQAQPPAKPPATPASGPRLGLVSRHLQWTSADHGIEVARQAGFPGIMWSVRPGAHVEAANVRTELPRIVKATRERGLEVPMIITGISGADSEGAEAILGTMTELGIGLYRAGAPRYDYNRPFDEQLSDFARRIDALAALNERYGATAAFHTHSYANSIGGSGWDLWLAMRGEDPARVGLNYDIGHVTAKGGAGWQESIRAVGPYLHSVSIKDFRWEKTENVEPGEWAWRTRFVEPGEGMVDFIDFFRYLQKSGFSGPLETYYEYTIAIPGSTGKMDMLGTNFGKWRLEVPESVFAAYLKRDVEFYKRVWQRALDHPTAPKYSVNAG